VALTLSDNTPSNGDISDERLTGHYVDICSSANDMGKKAVQIAGFRWPGRVPGPNNVAHAFVFLGSIIVVDCTN
jgi:hypothetical protein